jgi:hypothetical protein
MDKNLFWNEAEMKEVPTSPSVLALGDSWFWYPFPGANLLHPLAELMRRDGHRILVKGMNGAEIRDLVDGKYQRQVPTCARARSAAS